MQQQYSLSIYHCDRQYAIYSPYRHQWYYTDMQWLYDHTHSHWRRSGYGRYLSVGYRQRDRYQPYSRSYIRFLYTYTIVYYILLGVSDRPRTLR